MSVKFSDLPPDAQKRILDQLSQEAKRPATGRKKRTRKKSSWLREYIAFHAQVIGAVTQALGWIFSNLGKYMILLGLKLRHDDRLWIQALAFVVSLFYLIVLIYILEWIL